MNRKSNVDKYNALTADQKDRFTLLANTLITKVDNEITTDQFYGSREGVWNIIVWMPFLLALSDVQLSTEENNCVFPTKIPKQTRVAVDRRQVKATTYNR